MAKYKIRCQYSIIEEVEVEVEAPSADDAEELFLDDLVHDFIESMDVTLVEDEGATDEEI